VIEQLVNSRAVSILPPPLAVLDRMLLALTRATFSWPILYNLLSLSNVAAEWLALVLCCIHVSISAGKLAILSEGLRDFPQYIKENA
jgi:hypothetical protein